MTYNRTLYVLGVLSFALMFATVNANGQNLASEPIQEEPPMHIVEHISEGTENVIIMPDELRELLNFNKNGGDNKAKNSRIGYRVQVFSDNNARTAKNEARSKSRIITERFPEYPTYVIFSSPYWRLRVGDFKTQEEARDAADEIKKAFPSFGKEVHVVRDRINNR